MSFNPSKDIPDLSGKVILVTGGNTGLGLETVMQLSQHHPAHIYLAARSEEKAAAAIRVVESRVPNTPPITFLKLDLASFTSIKGAVASFQSQSSRLDLLVNNAGIMATPEALTEDGYEVQFGTNHLGHALLTQLLLPTLKTTAATESSDVRVIFVSSSGESQAPKDSYQFEKLKTTMASISTFSRYGVSKLANIHYSAALAEKNPDIKFISIHPGAVETGLSDSFIDHSNLLVGRIFKFAVKLSTVSVQKGALNQLWAATSQNAVSGEFYHPVGVAGKGSTLSRDGNVREKLWEWTQQELQRHVI